MNLSANEKTTLFLPAGQVLSVVAASGASGSAIRMAKLPGGGDAQSVTAIAGANLTFGPYAETERFEIICTAGTLTIATAVPDPATLATDIEVAAVVAALLTGTLSGSDTAHAPTVKAVFDALALKAPLASPSFTGATSFAAVGLPNKTPVNAVAAQGTLTVAAGGAKILDGDTVTIGTKTYTFKTVLTVEPITEGEVLIGANDTAALLNLKNAINHEGTPGTDYNCAAAHPDVTATSSDATTLVVTAKVKGVAGNAIATTETEAGTDKAWGADTLAGGIDGTVGVANEICADENYIYHCVGINTVSGANWRRIARGTVYY